MVYTNTKRVDGFGAQYQNIIYCILYYSKKNLPFVYTPLKTIEHNYTNDPSYISNLESLINITSYYPLANDTDIVIHEDKGPIYNHIESNIDEYFTSDEFRKIQNAFNVNKSVFNPEHFNIAIHIRVSNATDINLPSFRMTDLSYYVSIMNSIRVLHKDKLIKFHIYSQGDKSNFSCLDSDETIFHLDEPLTKTFIDLVFADILVTSKSSLSYTAALLNTHEIYYNNNFWHPPLKHWKRI